jgi:ANTAR domain-containing protein
MDDAATHDKFWHEDDKLHQAEGVLAARLDVSINEAAKALRAHAAAEATSPHELAPRVLDGTAIISP